MTGDVRINFRGRNNRLVVGGRSRHGHLAVDFDCDNATVRIGPSSRYFEASIRVGEDSKVLIGRDVSSTTKVTMSAAEGTTITIGDDVMFASLNQVRADDGHPIFDIHTGQRVNVSQSIRIGNHVWLGRSAAVLGGARIGDGTVIGYGSVVTRRIPNNCVAAGVPARVLRRDIGWDRAHLTLTAPPYKPDVSTVKGSKYWGPTKESTPPSLRRKLRRQLARVGWLRSVRAAVRARRRP